VNPSLIRFGGGSFLTHRHQALASSADPSHTCEVYGPTRHRSPGLLSASAGAAVCSLLAWLLVGLLALPLAVATATSGVLSSGGNGLAAISASALLLLLAQPLIAAGLLKVWVTSLSDYPIGFGTASLAMVVALVVDVAAAVVLPASLAFPLLGYSWAGAIVAGLIVSGGVR